MFRCWWLVALLLLVACRGEVRSPTAGLGPEPKPEPRLRNVRRLTAGGGVVDLSWPRGASVLRVIAQHGSGAAHSVVLDPQAREAHRAILKTGADGAAPGIADNACARANSGCGPSVAAEDDLSLAAAAGADEVVGTCIAGERLLFAARRQSRLLLGAEQSGGPQPGVGPTVELPGRVAPESKVAFSSDCSLVVWSAFVAGSLADLPSESGPTSARDAIELFVSRVDGSNARQLTFSGATAQDPVFTPEGSGVVFSTNYQQSVAGESDLWLVRVDGAHLERVTYASGRDRLPAFSPNGAQVAFVSERASSSAPRTSDVFVADWNAQSLPQAPDAAGRIARDSARLSPAPNEARPVAAFAAAAGQLFSEAGLRPAGADYVVPGGPHWADEADNAGYLRVMGLQQRAEDFRPLSVSRAGELRAPVKSVGFGIRAPELNYDDYAGLDVAGSLVVVQRFVPPLEPFQSLDARRRYGDLGTKLRHAIAAGATGVLLVDGNGIMTDVDDEAPFPGSPVAPAEELPLFVLAVRGKTLRMSWDRLEQQQVVWAELGVTKAPPVTGAPDVVGVLRASDKKTVASPLLLTALYSPTEVGAPDAGPCGGGVCTVATLAEVARQLAKTTERARPVVFIVSADEGAQATTIPPLPAALGVGSGGAALDVEGAGAVDGAPLAVFGAQSFRGWAAWGDIADASARLQARPVPGSAAAGFAGHFSRLGVPSLHVAASRGLASSLPSPLYASGAAQLARWLTTLAGVQLAAVPQARADRPASEPRWVDVRAPEEALGVTVSPLTAPAAEPGVAVAAVAAGSPAAFAGITSGDRLLTVAGVPITDVSSLRAAWRSARSRTTLPTTVVKDTVVRELLITP